jgi:DHA1 family bicyclomycin/chloramphenicol resistance-like MFS transporter
MTTKPGLLFAFALAAISFVGPLAVHLFMPVIPAVRVALHLSSSLAQLTFSIALFGMAFSTLFYGSLSDRYGRRPVLLFGLALFLVGSAISAFAVSVSTLVLGRLVQAIGAGCGITLGRAIAQDVYGPQHLVKVIAYLTMAYTIGPMISPMVGGILIDAFGWRSVFAFALVFGAVIAACAYFAIFETRPPSPNRVRVNWLRSYGELFGHVRFTAFVLQSGFMTGAFLATATATANLMKDMLQRPSTEFGIYFLLFPFGYLFGNFITSRIGNRAANETMVLIGSLFLIGTIATQSAILLSGYVTPVSLFVPGFFITMSQGLSLSYAQAGAMATNPKLAGTAAGIGVFMQNFLGAAFAQFYGFLADGTVTPLTEVTAICALCGLCAALVPFWMVHKLWAAKL